MVLPSILWMKLISANEVQSFDHSWQTFHVCCVLFSRLPEITGLKILQWLMALPETEYQRCKRNFGGSFMKPERCCGFAKTNTLQTQLHCSLYRHLREQNLFLGAFLFSASQSYHNTGKKTRALEISKLSVFERRR